MVAIVEGQVFEGPVSALGGEGPDMRWIVVSPYGKRHAHSLHDPLDLHCMPLGIMIKAIEQQRLNLVETLADHPIVRLQRAKEERGLVDTHMGLHGNLLEQMLGMLDTAVAEGVDYAPFLAGEILAQSGESNHAETDIEAARQRVFATMAEQRPGA